MDHRRVLRFGGAALAAAVWALLIFSPRQGGLSASYVLTFSLLLSGVAAVDLTAPHPDAPRWRRLAWLAAELALAYAVVQAHHTFIRPVFVYLVPTMRAVLMFEGRAGLAVSLAAWAGVALNIWGLVWADRLTASPDYLAIFRDGLSTQQTTALTSELQNYLLFFLAPYLGTVALTSAMTQQAAHRRRFERLYSELHSAHEELKSLHARVRETAVAEERNRLAREIHDSLAHYLTIINVQLEAAEKLHPQEEARDQVRRARRLTLDCLQEVRHSVAALRASNVDELSLPLALQKLTDEFTRNTGIPVTVTLDVPRDVSLAPETSLALYRSVQEGLTNVHRHAHAHAATLSLARQNGSVELTVQDDGVGPPEPSASGGFGLLGLRERVALLDGQVCFGRAPAGGARLIVTLPVDWHRR